MGLPSNVLYIKLTESTREVFQNKLKSLFPKLSFVYVDGIQAAMTGLVSNAISLIPYVPADVISARLIVQGLFYSMILFVHLYMHETNLHINAGRKDIGALNMARLIYKERGFQGFFRGYNVSLLFCTL